MERKRGRMIELMRHAMDTRGCYSTIQSFSLCSCLIIAKKNKGEEKKQYIITGEAKTGPVSRRRRRRAVGLG